MKEYLQPSWKALTYMEVKQKVLDKKLKWQNRAKFDEVYKKWTGDRIQKVMDIKAAIIIKFKKIVHKWQGNEWWKTEILEWTYANKRRKTY